MARATGPDLLRSLLPTWMVLFLVVVELDVIVDFREVARRASALPPGWAAVAIVGLCGVFTVSSRKLVADLWLGPRHAVLRRQPLPPTAWGPASLVVLVPVAAPVGVGALFWYGGTAWPAAVTWLGLAVVPTVLAAGRWWAPWIAACAVAGGVAAIGQVWPGSYLGWMVAVWVVAVPLAGFCTVRCVSWTGVEVGRSPRRPQTVFGAVVHRDLLALWRRERAIGVPVLLAVPGIAFVVRAMRVNGGYPGPTLTTATVVLLALVGPLALQAATGVARQLGRRFDPPEWPVTAVQRAGSLGLVAAGTLVPGWAAAAVVAPPIGVVGHVRIAVFVAAIGAGAAWWVVSRPGRPNPGSWPYWIAACLLPVVVPWGPVVTGVLGGVAFVFAVRGLEQRRGRP